MSRFGIGIFKLGLLCDPVGVPFLDPSTPYRRIAKAQVIRMTLVLYTAIIFRSYLPLCFLDI